MCSLCHLTTLVIAVHTGQQVDFRWEISMELDEEQEDTHGYQPSGFLNPLTLPEAKGYPSSRFPNLYGMVTHMGIRNPPGFTPGNFPASPIHHFCEHDESHRHINFCHTWGGYLFSGLYPELPGLSPIEELSALEQDSTSRGTAVPHPWG